MKNAIRTLPAKIACFILTIVLLSVGVLGAIGAAVLIEADFYTQTKQDVIRDSLDGRVSSDMYTVMYNSFAYTETETTGHIAETDNALTNLRFQLRKPDGTVLFANTNGIKETAYNYKYYFEVIKHEDYTEVNHLGDSLPPDKDNYYIVEAYIERDFPVMDEYSFIYAAVSLGFSLRFWIYPITLVSLILSVVCFITLMCVAGRQPHSEEIHAGHLHQVPFDLLVAIILGIFLFVLYLICDVFYSGETVLTFTLVFYVLIAISVGLGLCMSAAVRIKDRTLIKKSAVAFILLFLLKAIKATGRGIKKVIKQIWVLIRNIPLIWRTVLIIAGIIFIEFLWIQSFWYRANVYQIIWVLEKIILVPIALYAALFLRRLQKGGEALARGELDYKTDTKYMFWDFKRHGENLNSISKGLSAAVEERIKSERTKAELITNVSHDIKTPLTSIINYAGLISEETCENEKHREYSDVLIRKSEHLKRLLEDLVEISKASTGNLDIHLASCDAGVLLSQVSGEFLERCNASGLTLITNQPNEKITIFADSRRIWRVFENLMSNACKYSLRGSRVYLSLEKVGTNAVFTFRNTSAAELNVSPDELMERFVRGEESRTTEGNGLGLSIAKSLTELQNGKMDIVIDGDLFKVCVRFPVL